MYFNIEKRFFRSHVYLKQMHKIMTPTIEEPCGKKRYHSQCWL